MPAVSSSGRRTPPFPTPPVQILEGALEVSEYTSNVDVSSNMYGYFWSMGVSKKSNIIKHQLREVLSFVSGLYVSSDFKSGQKLVSGPRAPPKQGSG